MDTWDIGVDPWIILDGNYPNFWRGQTAKFAVEFWYESFGLSSEPTKRAHRRTTGGHSTITSYEVNAEIVPVAEWQKIVFAPPPGTMDHVPRWDAQGNPIFHYGPLVRQVRPTPVHVLDCGIRAYQYGDKELPTVPGTFITASVRLSVDPFFYFAHLYAVPGVPPLIYTWYIERITLFTAPLVEIRDKEGRPRREHDLVRVVSQDIEQTNASRDNKGRGWYILHCRKLDDAPARMERNEMQAYYARHAD